MVTHIDQSYISQLLTAMEGETFLEKRGEGKDVGWQDFFVFVLFRLGGGGRDIQVIRSPHPPCTYRGTDHVQQKKRTRKPNYEAPMRTVLLLWWRYLQKDPEYIFGGWGENRDPKERRFSSDTLQAEEWVLYSLAASFAQIFRQFVSLRLKTLEQ